MARRLTLLFVGALFLVLAASSAAAAGHAPQDIYDDYASDGRLDGAYSDAELRAFLNDGRVHEYGDPSITANLDEVAMHLSVRELFPVSGFQIAMAVLVVVILIVGGIMLRRLSRPRKPTDPAQPTQPAEPVPPPEPAPPPEELRPPESPDGP